MSKGSYEVGRTDEEVDALLNELDGQINVGGSRFSGQTYEQGVQEGIRWLLGETEDHPYPES